MSLDFLPIKSKVSIINITIPFPVSISTEILSGSFLSPDKILNAKHAFACLALFKFLDFKLQGNELKTKLAEIYANVQNKNLILTVKCVPNFTVTRKVLGIICKYLQPQKLFPIWKKYISSIEIDGSKEEFAHCSNMLCKGIKNMHVLVISSINASKVGDLKKQLNLISTENISKEVNVPIEKSGKHDCDIECKSQFDALLISKFLKSVNIDSTVHDKNVCVVVGNSKLQTITDNLKDRAIKYGERLASIDKDKLHEALMISAATSGLFNNAEIKSVKTDKTSILKSLIL